MSAPLPAEAGCETCWRFVLQYCWPFLRTNNTAIHLQTFTSNNSSKRFSAYNHQGSNCEVFPPSYAFVSRPECLGLMMKNRVESVFWSDKFISDFNKETSLHGWNKQGINRKFLIGNLFHVTLRIVSLIILFCHSISGDANLFETASYFLCTEG